MGPQNHCLSEGNYKEIGKLTFGYSGADMANLCKESALGPIRSLDYSKMNSIRCLEIESALKQVKALVSDKDLQNYHNWNKQYGSAEK